jgi:hypothetical protein
MEMSMYKKSGVLSYISYYCPFIRKKILIIMYLQRDVNSHTLQSSHLTWDPG